MMGRNIQGEMRAGLPLNGGRVAVWSAEGRVLIEHLQATVRLWVLLGVKLEGVGEFPADKQQDLPMF